MPEPIMVVDRSEIRDGKVEELQMAAEHLAEFVASNEARPIAYNFYFDDAGRAMTVVQVHPDSASMEEHMRVADAEFRRFADLLMLRTMDVYGAPSETAIAQLGRKVQMLGTATLRIHRRHAGFLRT